MASFVHSTAVVEDGAILGDNVYIGPYCVIGEHVKIGDGTILKSHVNISGITDIGENNKIFPFVSIDEPQDLKFHGESSKVIIGNNNTIREYTTIQHGTEAGSMETIVGDNNLFMVGAHVAHDCIVGNNCILANNATLGGHVILGDYVVLGGLSAIHQKARIGRHAMVGGVTGVRGDVIPFGSVIGDMAELVGLNLVGMKRRNFPREQIHAVRNFYKEMFEQNPDKTIAEKIPEMKNRYEDDDLVQEIIEFMENAGQRSLCTPARHKIHRG